MLAGICEGNDWNLVEFRSRPVHIEILMSTSTDRNSNPFVSLDACNILRIYITHTQCIEDIDNYCMATGSG